MKTRPVLTIALILLTLGTYFAFSNAYLYIRQDRLLALAFSWHNVFPGIITYMFAHIGLKHLFGNMLLLLLVGAICEEKLRKKDYLAIYFASGAAGAVLFSAINPNVALAGASACIAGLMVPAMIINTRRFVLGMILVAVFSTTVMMPVLTVFSESLHQKTVKEYTVLKQEYENVTKEKQELQTIILELNKTEEKVREKLEKGEITEREYMIIIQNVSLQRNATLAKLAEKEQEEKKVSEGVNKTLELKENLEQGIEREKRMVTSVLVHALGSVVGATYLLLFRRDILYDAVFEWKNAAWRLKKRLARSS